MQCTRGPTEGAEGVAMTNSGLVAFLMQNLMENKMRGVTEASKAQKLEKISFEVGILTRESLMARIQIPVTGKRSPGNRETQP